MHSDHPQSGNSKQRLIERISALPPEKIRELAREARKRKGQPTQTANDKSPLVPVRTFGTKPPLFLLHPVGGGVQPYFQLAEYLHPEQPVYALENHEFGSHEEHSYASIEEMAEQYIRAIRAVQRSGPLLLGGWSMGGILAFEMALQLQQQGERLGPLIMIDAPAQFVSRSQEQSPEAEFARSLVLLGRIWAHQKKKEFTLLADTLEPLNPGLQLDRFIQAVKEKGIVAPEADDAALRAAVKTFIHNNRACEKYVPRRYEGPVIVLRASEIQQETKEDTELVFDDPSFGWQAFCSHPVIVHHVPGDHMFMMLEPHVQSLAAILQQCLDSAAVANPAP